MADEDEGILNIKLDGANALETIELMKRLRLMTPEERMKFVEEAEAQTKVRQAALLQEPGDNTA